MVFSCCERFKTYSNAPEINFQNESKQGIFFYQHAAFGIEPSVVVTSFRTSDPTHTTCWLCTINGPAEAWVHECLIKTQPNNRYIHEFIFIFRPNLFGIQTTTHLRVSSYPEIRFVYICTGHNQNIRSSCRTHPHGHDTI